MMKEPRSPVGSYAWLLEKILDAYYLDNPLVLVATVRVAAQFAIDNGMYKLEEAAPQQPGPGTLPGPVDDPEPTHKELAQG